MGVTNIITTEEAKRLREELAETKLELLKCKHALKLESGATFSQIETSFRHGDPDMPLSCQVIEELRKENARLKRERRLFRDRAAVTRDECPTCHLIIWPRGRDCGAAMGGDVCACDEREETR